MSDAIGARRRLGQILLSSGVASRDALIRAWEQRVLFGDRLGTNLLTTGALGEEALARALGEQHMVPAAFGANLDVSDTAVRRLPRAFAAERFVVPHHFDGGTLFLLMRDPDDIVTRHDVYRMTGMVVVPVVVVEARMWSLLARHYGARIGLRPVPLDDEHATPRVESQRPSRPPSMTPDARGAGELMSESEFFALYVKSTTDEIRAVDLATIEQARAVVDEAPRDLGAPAARVGDLRRPIGESHADFVLPSDEPLVAPRPVASTHADEEWIARPSGELFRVPPSTGERSDPLPAPSARPHATREQKGATRALAAPRTPRDVASRVDGATSRDEVLELLLAAARSVFKRVVIFTVFPTTIAVSRAEGEGMRGAALEGYEVSLDERTVFAMVAESRAHYLGPLQTYRAHGEFVKRAGKKLPASIAVLPILVGERVVALVYGDDGHGARVASDVGELLILTSKVSKKLEALMQAAH